MNDRMNTTMGWVLGSAAIALGGSIVAGIAFESELPEAPGYIIEAPEEVAGGDAGPSLAELLASGTAEAGEGVFAKCGACHTINQGGANGIGPNLYGVMGTNIGEHAPGYDYSSALSGHGGVWDIESMDAWLQSPRGFADGTKMSFAGLGNGQDRADIILYMIANGGGPPLPAVEEAAPAEGEEAADGEAVEAADTGADEAATEEAPAAE